MVNTCVGSTAVPQFSVFSLANPICFGVLLLARIYVHHVEYWTRPPDPNDPRASPQYGIGALLFYKAFLGLGMAYTFASSILFFLFFHIHGGSGLEIACQSQAGFVGVVFPFLFVYGALALLVTNRLRAIWTRYEYANIVSEGGTLLPVNVADKVATLVFLGTSRGAFVPPFVRTFAKAVGSGKTVRVVALDAFNTKYYPESDKWVHANMAIEGICPYKSEPGAGASEGPDVETTIKRILYGSKLEFEDNSVDVVVIPTGMVLTYLSEVADEPTKHAHRLMYLLNEIHRILKPEGKFVTSNMVFLLGSMEKGLRASKFGEDNIDLLLNKNPDDKNKAPPSANTVEKNFVTLGKWLWWSYIPAKVTIATKKALPRVDQADTVETGVVTSPISQDDTIPSFDASSPDSSAFFDEEDLKIHHWFPRGSHWRLVEALMALTLLAWVAYVILTWQCLRYLALPYFLPYDQQISALFISNANILPFVLYIICARLRSVALLAESQVRKLTLGNAPDPSTASAFLRSRVLSAYYGELFDLVLLLTLNSGLGWLPYFLFDMLLIKAFGVQDKMVTNLNTVLSVVITVVFIGCASFLAKWYAKIKSRQSKQQDQQAEAEARQSMATIKATEEDQWGTTISNASKQHFNVASAYGDLVNNSGSKTGSKTQSRRSSRESVGISGALIGRESTTSEVV